MLLQDLDVAVGDLFGEAGENLPLQAHAGFEDVMGLRQARLGDGRALVRLQIHQSLRVEARQSGANDGAADPEAVADHVLGQLVPRHQRLLDDGAPQAIIDRFAAGTFRGFDLLGDMVTEDGETESGLHHFASILLSHKCAIHLTNCLHYCIRTFSFGKPPCR